MAHCDDDILKFLHPLLWERDGLIYILVAIINPRQRMRLSKVHRWRFILSFRNRDTGLYICFSHILQIPDSDSCSIL